MSKFAAAITIVETWLGHNIQRMHAQTRQTGHNIIICNGREPNIFDSSYYL